MSLLAELVAAPHVTEKSKRHWAVVLQHEEVLRSRLSELGLVLEVNREHRFASAAEVIEALRACESFPTDGAGELSRLLTMLLEPAAEGNRASSTDANHPLATDPIDQ